MGIYEDANQLANEQYGNTGLAGLNDQERIDYAIARGEAVADKYMSATDRKAKRLDERAQEKRARLRKDNLDYGDDGFLVQGAKKIWNSFADHDHQMAINKNGHRYNTENKIFNDNDMSNIWNEVQEDPYGDQVLYYLRKHDGKDENGNDLWLYKPGIAKVSAYDRYAGQLSDKDWELIGEKRFSGSNLIENQIHGNKEFLKSRAFDYGRYSDDKREAERKGLAYDDFGPGRTELYTKDILGIDNNDEAQYAKNKALSKQRYIDSLDQPYMHEDTFESLDALGAAAQTLAGKGLKFVGELASSSEGDGALETYGKKLMADANKDWDYNDKALKDGVNQMNRGIYDMSHGSPISGLFNMVGGVLKSAPQAVAGSIPEMSAYVGGGIGSIAIRAGLLAMANANDELDQREIANGGRKATDSEIASVMAAETVASLLDLGAFRFVTLGAGKGLGIGVKGSKSGAKFEDVISKMDNAGKYELGKAIAKSIARGGEAFGTEAVQETSTEALRMLAEQLGTDQYGDNAKDILSSGQGKARLMQSFLLGGAGGVGFNIPHNTIHTLKDAGSAFNTMSKVKKGKEAQSADSKQDAVMKSMLAEDELKNAETTYNNLGKTSDTLNTMQVEPADNDLEEISKVINDPNSGLTIEQKAAMNQQLTKIKKDRSNGKKIKTEQITDTLSQTVADFQKKVGTYAQSVAIAKGGLDKGIMNDRYGDVLSEEDEVHSSRKDEVAQLDKELNAKDEEINNLKTSKQNAIKNQELFAKKKEFDDQITKFSSEGKTDEAASAIKSSEELASQLKDIDEVLNNQDATRDISKDISEIETSKAEIQAKKDEVLAKLKRKGEELVGIKKHEQKAADLENKDNDLKSLIDKASDKDTLRLKKESLVKNSDNIKKTENEIGEIDSKIKIAKEGKNNEDLDTLEKQLEALHVEQNKLNALELTKENNKIISSESTINSKKINKINKKISEIKDNVFSLENYKTERINHLNTLNKASEDISNSIKEIESNPMQKEIITDELADNNTEINKINTHRPLTEDEQAHFNALETRNEEIKKILGRKDLKTDSEIKEAENLYKEYKSNKEELKQAEESINKIDKEMTAEIAMKYDPVGKQVKQVKKTAKNMAKDLNMQSEPAKTTEEKMSISSRIVKYTLDKVSGKIKDIKKTRGAFSEKLSKVSNAALKRLLTKESVDEIEQLFTDKRGYKPFSRKQIVKAIEDEVKRRNKSDEFFGKNKSNIAGSPVSKIFGRKFAESRGEINNYYKEVTETLDDKTLNKEDRENFIKEANEKITSMFNDMNDLLNGMSNQDIRRFAGDMQSDLFVNLKKELGSISPIAANNIKIMEDTAKELLTPESRKSFMLNIAKAHAVEDNRDIEMALEDLDYLHKDGIVNDEQHDALKKTIEAVGIRAKEQRTQFAKEVSEENKKRISEIDKEISESEVLSDKMKKQMLNYPESMKIQLSNTFDIMDDETMIQLQRANISIKEKDIYDSSSETTLEIKINC